MKLGKLSLAAVVLFASVYGTASAALIGAIGTVPDIGASGLTVSYTVSSGTGTFTATGNPVLMSYDDGSGPVEGFIGSYSLSAMIDIATETVTGGSLVIDDAADTYDLTATILEFGFLNDDPADKWDFLSDITASSAAIGITTQLYTIFPNLGSAFVDLNTDFSVSDVNSNNRQVGVPLPPTVALLAAGVLGFAARRKRT